MVRILIATEKKDKFSAFTRSLSEASDVDLRWAPSPVKVLESVAEFLPHLVVVDEKIENLSGVELIRRLMSIDAMIDTVLVSTDSKSVFHQQTEGLGILAQLPPNPDPSNALDLLATVRSRRYRR